MGLIKEIVEDVAKSAVTSEVKTFIEKNRQLLIEDAVKTAFLKTIEKELSEEIKKNLPIEGLSNSLKGINHLINNHAQELTVTLKKKLKEAVQKISIEIEMPPETKRMLQIHLKNAFMEALNQGIYTTQSVLKKKVLSAITHTKFFINEKAMEESHD